MPLKHVVCNSINIAHWDYDFGGIQSTQVEMHSTPHDHAQMIT